MLLVQDIFFHSYRVVFTSKWLMSEVGEGSLLVDCLVLRYRFTRTHLVEDVKQKEFFSQRFDWVRRSGTKKKGRRRKLARFLQVNDGKRWGENREGESRNMDDDLRRRKLCNEWSKVLVVLNRLEMRHEHWMWRRWMFCPSFTTILSFFHRLFDNLLLSCPICSYMSRYSFSS